MVPHFFDVDAMKSAQLLVALLTSLYPRLSQSRPDGAPAGACDNLTPLQSPSGHADPPQRPPVPYTIDLSPFSSNGTFQYTPRGTYTLTLSPVPGRGADFQGFLVQARTVADGTTRVGSFGVVDAANSKLSSCPIDTDGITHTNSNGKSSVSFAWTAPPPGSGPVVFGFAVAKDVNTYWANQRLPRAVVEGVSTETVSTTVSDSLTSESQPMATTAAAYINNAEFMTVLIVAFGSALKALCAC